MIRRRPDLVVLVVVLVGTLATVATFLGSLLLSRASELEIGERRVRDFGVMVGEHTARSFEAVDILLREIAIELSEHQRDWENWEASRGWDYLAKRHAKSLPQLRDLIVFDRDGLQRYISTYFPTPRINVRDRPYFIALKAGQRSTTYGPYIGRNSGRYTYALARRIDDAERKFAGVAFAAIETGYFQDFCWANRLARRFRIGHHQRHGPDRRHLPSDRSQQAIADARRTRAGSALRRPLARLAAGDRRRAQ